jgi:DNA-binding transcriptional LysR family regulator
MGHALLRQRRFAPSQLAARLDEPPMMLGAAYAITHPTRRPAAKTRAWIDFLAEALPALGTAW